MQARLRVKGSSGTAKKSSCTASKNASACSGTSRCWSRTLVWISRWKDERVSALCCNKASGMMNIATLLCYMIT